MNRREKGEREGERERGKNRAKDEDARIFQVSSAGRGSSLSPHISGGVEGWGRVSEKVKRKGWGEKWWKIGESEGRKKERDEGESWRMRVVSEELKRERGGGRACHYRGEEDGPSPPAAPLLSDWRTTCLQSPTLPWRHFKAKYVMCRSASRHVGARAHAWSSGLGYMVMESTELHR